VWLVWSRSGGDPLANRVGAGSIKSGPDEFAHSSGGLKDEFAHSYDEV
jgi:hypothetical protein